MSGDNPLHRARVERGIDLAEVARRTCLSPQVVQRIDSGRFDQLPAGVYARSYVRSFAAAVGLDQENALAAVSERLPSAEDPLPVMRDVADRTTYRWIRPLLAIPGSVATVAAAATSSITRHLSWPAFAWPSTRVRHRLTAEVSRRRDRGLRWRGAHGFTTPARRLAAIAVDAAVLVLLHVLLVQLTSWTTGAAPASVLSAAGLGVTTVWALLVVQYYLLLGGVGGRTPGAWLFGLRQRATTPRATPLGLRAILHRTVMY